MKKSSIIAIGLSTLLVVCNALPMNNHVESKKEEGLVKAVPESAKL